MKSYSRFPPLPQCCSSAVFAADRTQRVKGWRSTLFGVLLLLTGPLAAQTALHPPAASAASQYRYWDADADSLRRVLAEQRADTARLRTLMHLADIEPIPTAVAAVLAETSEAARLSARLRRPEQRAYHLLETGNRLFVAKALAPAIDSLQAAIVEFDRLSRPVPWLVGSLRVLYNSLKQQEAKGAYFKAKLTEYRQRGATANEAACHHALGGYYVNLGDYNQAVGHYLQAAALYRPTCRRQYFNTLAFAGNSYMEWGNPAKGLQYLQQAVAEGDGQGLLAFVYLNLARVHLYQRHYPAALQALDQCLVSLPKGNLSPQALKAHVFTLQSAVLLGQGRGSGAGATLRAAQQLADSLQIPIYGTGGYLELDATWARYHEARGDAARSEAAWLTAYGKAQGGHLTPLRLAYLRELTRFYHRRQPAVAAGYALAAQALADTLERAQGALHVTQYEIEQADRAKNQRIAGLRLAQVQDAARAHRQRLMLLAVIGGSLLLLVGIVAVYYAFRRSVRLNHLVTHQKQDLQTQRDRLDTSLTELRTTQQQLIQKEKMASLGELTAGIAHEIQNPLNFVNNFADVSAELVADLREERAKGTAATAGLEEELLEDLTQNLSKIGHHGRRAAGIVKGMLEHSTSSAGERQATDLNRLCAEYLRLAHQGLRTKDNDFHVELRTDFSPDLPAVTLVGPDVGRVLLNVLTNAFYAVRQRQQHGEPGYQPTVRVATKQVGQQVLIQISDNGTGMSPAVQGKVFQPFFTTKPTGEGTGLGLSLAHDIIAQGHGGTLQVESQEGQGTTFSVALPLNRTAH
jgi:two-component system NtrC family sensor kinase